MKYQIPYKTRLTSELLDKFLVENKNLESKKHLFGIIGKCLKLMFLRLPNQPGQTIELSRRQMVIFLIHFQKIFRIMKFSNKLNFRNQIKFIIIIKLKDKWKVQDTINNIRNKIMISNKDMPLFPKHKIITK
jgi:hypothetical protein